MTTILQQHPPSTPYLLRKFKQTIREGDTIIFQWNGGTEEKPAIEEDKRIVATASGPDEAGIHAGWQVVTFKEEV